MSRYFFNRPIFSAGFQPVIRYEKPVKRKCVICGKMFSTIEHLRIACEPCLNEDGGEVYARWWNEHHPIAEGVMERMIVGLNSMHRDPNGISFGEHKNKN